MDSDPQAIAVSKRKDETPTATAAAAEAGGNQLHTRTPYRINDETLVALASAIRFETAPETLRVVRDFEKKYALGMERLRALAEHGVRKLLEEQTASGIAAVASGDVTARGTYRTKSQLREDATAEKHAMKAGIRAIAAQAIEAIRPEAERFTREANAYIDELEAVERGQAEKFTVAHVPSPFIAQLRAATASVITRLPAPIGLLYQRPSSFVSWTTI